MRTTEKTIRATGRPPIALEMWEKIAQMARAGMTPAQIIKADLGVKKTKVYEIVRIVREVDSREKSGPIPSTETAP